MLPLISAGLSAPPWCMHTHMHTLNTHTHSLSLSGQTVQTHPALSPMFVCLYVHACVLTAARQTVNKQYCLMSVCDSVCLLWVCLSLCVRICVLVWGRWSLSETETKRAFLFTLELGEVPNERLWIWWGGSLQPSSVSHTKVSCLPPTGWASISLFSQYQRLPLFGMYLCVCVCVCVHGAF